MNKTFDILKHGKCQSHHNTWIFGKVSDCTGVAAPEHICDSEKNNISPKHQCTCCEACAKECRPFIAGG